jgi:hypothetical protein
VKTKRWYRSEPSGITEWSLNLSGNGNPLRVGCHCGTWLPAVVFTMLACACVGLALWSYASFQASSSGGLVWSRWRGLGALITTNFSSVSESGASISPESPLTRSLKTCRVANEYCRIGVAHWQWISRRVRGPLRFIDAHNHSFRDTTQPVRDHPYLPIHRQAH